LSEHETWNVETLKAHFDQRLLDSDKAVTAALAAAEKAVGKAETNAEKWRENANEWRAAMMDREARFASRTEVDTEFRNIRQELASLKETRAETLGTKVVHEDNRANILAIIAVIGAVVAVIKAFIH
jgi:hypothetical protein